MTWQNFPYYILYNAKTVYPPTYILQVDFMQCIPVLSLFSLNPAFAKLVANPMED